MSGIVVARRDAQALAMAIASLARDPERCRAMGRAGRSRVKERFSPERQIQAFAEFYVRALADSQADAETPRRLDAGGSGGPAES